MILFVTLKKSVFLNFRLIFYIYVLVFIIFAQRFFIEQNIWRYQISAESIPYANLLVISSIIFFELGYNSKYNTISRNHFRIIRPIRPIWIFTYFLSIFLIFLSIGYSPSISFIRTIFYEDRFSPFAQLLNSLFIFTSFFFFVSYFIRHSTYDSDKSSTRSFVFLLCLLLFLLSIGPFSNNRFITFTLYLPFLLLMFRGKFNRGELFLLLMPLALIISFLQDVFRGYTSASSLLSIRSLNNYMYSGTFDSFENVTHLITYTFDHGFTYGKQFFSALLFFIPRSLIPDKSIGPGEFIAEKFLSNNFVLSSVNISSPLFAELWLDFGPLAFLLLYFIGQICCNMDNKFFSSFPSYFSSLYTSGLGSFFFLLRGGLMSSLALILSIVFSYFLLKPLVTDKSV